MEYKVTKVSKVHNSLRSIDANTSSKKSVNSNGEFAGVLTTECMKYTDDINAINKVVKGG